MLIVDAHLDLVHERARVEPGLPAALPEIRERERGKTDKPDRGRGCHLIRGDAQGRDRPVRRHADRALCEPGQIRCRAGTARSRRGHRPRDSSRGIARWRRPASSCRSWTSRVSTHSWLAGARRRIDGHTHRLRPQPRGRRLDHHARASRAGVRPGSARPRTRPTTAPADTRRAPTRRAGCGREAANFWRRWSGSTSFSTPRTSPTRASSRRSTISAGASGPATTIAARSSRTTASSRTSRSHASSTRDAIIGMPLDAWMMVPGWVRGTVHAAEHGRDAADDD